VTGVVPTNGHILTPRWDLRQCELLNVFVPCALASRVISANMGGELLVALQLEVAHHFIERCAGERTRRFEPPTTFGATKTTKTLLLNPYQLPAHGCLCCCVPTNTHLLSRDETFWFAINGSFRVSYCPIAPENRSPSSGKNVFKEWPKFTCANLYGQSGTLHT